MSVVSLGYLVVESTDLDRWRRFANDLMGFMVKETPDGALQLRIDDRPFRFLIVPGTEKVIMQVVPQRTALTGTGSTSTAPASSVSGLSAPPTSSKPRIVPSSQPTHTSTPAAVAGPAPAPRTAQSAVDASAHR